ncbi:MAG: hypothetical protein E7321_10600 [Clostridiales bacterium]|nr:hypothetical protein [Clostridiales bacterium]
MYSFQANAGRKKNKQIIRLLYLVIFILILALIGVSVAYFRSTGVSEATSSALLSRALSEATEAQSAVYRLTQSSGTNTMTLLSTVRAHVHTLQSINTIAANIYGVGTSLSDGELLASCIDIITQCETRMQAGSVLTDLFTQLRDQVDLIVTGFGGVM